MKILQISANWGHGGPGGVVKDIYNSIISSGNECVVSYGRYDIPDDVPSIKIGSSFDVRIHAGMTRLFDCAGFGSKRATRKFLEKVDQLKPDVIHLHNLIGYYLDIEQLFNYIKQKNIPVVWTVHDCWAFTGHCINFERVQCEKWKIGCGKCPLKRDYPQSFLIDNSKNNLSKKKIVMSGVNNMILVSPSHWLAGYLRRSFLNEYPIEVFPNGIDMSVFKPSYSNLREQYGLEDKKIVLAVASEWNEMKGEHLIYELVALLSNAYVVVMIGHKQQNMESSDRFINIPKTSNVQELVEWYSAADVFVNPTLGDNFPTVNLEALACGTPIVTNNTGGAPEAVLDSGCGQVVYEKNASAIMQTVEDCLMREIPSAACVQAAQKYNRDICNLRYIELYQKLIG